MTRTEGDLCPGCGASGPCRCVHVALTTATARPVEGLCPRCWLPRLWHVPVVALFDSGPLEAGHFLVCEDCGQLPVDDTEETDQ